MSDGNVRLDIEGTVAVILLDRPAKLNALTPVMLDQLQEIAARIDHDHDVRVVLLTAAGDRAFCAGADIDAWSQLAPVDMWRRWIRDGHIVFDRLAQLRQPMIAVIDGLALGGGLELALTADIRVAEQQAKLVSRFRSSHDFRLLFSDFDCSEAEALDGAEDVIGGFGPFEGFWGSGLSCRCSRGWCAPTPWWSDGRRA